jgi:hypothetical protein
MKEGEERAFAIKTASIKRLLREIETYRAEVSDIEREERGLLPGEDYGYRKRNTELRRRETELAMESIERMLARFIGEAEDMAKKNPALVMQEDLREKISSVSPK